MALIPLVLELRLPNYAYCDVEASTKYLS